MAANPLSQNPRAVAQVWSSLVDGCFGDSVKDRLRRPAACRIGVRPHRVPGKWEFPARNPRAPKGRNGRTGSLWINSGCSELLSERIRFVTTSASRCAGGRCSRAVLGEACRDVCAIVAGGRDRRSLGAVIGPARGDPRAPSSRVVAARGESAGQACERGWPRSLDVVRSGRDRLTRRRGPGRNTRRKSDAGHRVDNEYSTDYSPGTLFGHAASIAGSHFATQLSHCVPGRSRTVFQRRSRSLRRDRPLCL
ncbi:hypothetical protein FHU35_14241 [Saccharopolyspora dendranthemae]|uniref:Uncharacterized protein n=1 Tax=Saccharopolyspora dendranthemae TaxID=1181886 RepID=A0A561U3L6_9PSEU|nr:hypothetical protein FHU35_14241 [Saccharopolyspora dendranthemae]